LFLDELTPLSQFVMWILLCLVCVVAQTQQDYEAAEAIRDVVARGGKESVNAMAELSPEVRMIAARTELARESQAFRAAAKAGGKGSAAYDARRAYVMTNRYAGRAGRLAQQQGIAMVASNEAGVNAYFDGLRRATGKQVVSAAGFSGQGYQNPEEAARFIKQAVQESGGAAKVVLNGGVTDAGIGAIGYDVGQSAGAQLTGVASEQALLGRSADYNPLKGVYRAKTVEGVPGQRNFFIKGDTTWGGGRSLKSIRLGLTLSYCSGRERKPQPNLACFCPCQ
jgi:hypothetical protein